MSEHDTIAALWSNVDHANAHIIRLLAKIEEREKIINACIGRMMNAKFDIECGTKDQAAKNLSHYIKLAKDELEKARAA